LGEIGDSLFDCVIHFRGDVTFVGTVFVGISDDLGDAERVGMEWCLGNKSVGKGDAQKTGDASCEAQEKKIPVEACWFAKGKFGALGY